MTTVIINEQVLAKAGAYSSMVREFLSVTGDEIEIDVSHNGFQLGILMSPFRKYLGWFWYAGVLPRWSMAGLIAIEADLYRADLRGADLRRANLREVNLRLAYLKGVDLAGADLRGADLRWADLYRANLGGAVLYKAGLYMTDLRQAVFDDE